MKWDIGNFEPRGDKRPHACPLWITVEGGDVFEGHIGHWQNCFFDFGDEINNAIESNPADADVIEDIKAMIQDYCDHGGWKVVFEVRS